MSRFLDALAETFANVPRLGDYCFLFPTRRAGRFFLNILGDKIRQSTLLPRVDTLGHWVERCVKTSRVSDREPVFILYNAYCSLLRQNNLPEPEFEQFRHWGEILAADFQDIDRNLVDAEKVFRNVRNLREISTDYLTDKQREIIKRYWGADVLSNMAASPERVNRFWQTAVRPDSKPSSVSHKYLRLWEVLPQLYHTLNEGLRAVGTATQGMMLRELAENINPNEILSNMGVTKLVFAGFDYLSLSELEIMSRLQKDEAAYFYWDIPPMLSRISPESGYPLIKKLAENFPEPEDLPLMRRGHAKMPAVEIVGIPGHHAQTRAAAVTLKQWGEDKNIIQSPQNAINTAIILPETDLFLPMVHAVPSEFEKINVTVGVPLRQTPVGTLMQQVVRMQTRARRKRDGETTYYYEDVKALLTNPMVRAYAADEADDTLKRITEQHLIRITPQQLTQAARLRPLFVDPDTDPNLNSRDTGAVYAFISGIADFLRQADAANPRGRHKLTELFIDSYSRATQQLCAHLETHHINMRNTTLLKMIQQTLSTAEVPLSGEPVEGLQIMGVRETQALDFENIQMLSMNENVFPQKSYRQSIIPDLLRTAWGLSTPRQISHVLAYRFFRLIAHAQHVALFYDTRADRLRNPRMSRFIYQLIYMPGVEKPSHTVMQFPLTASPKRALSLKRDERVRQKLRCFLPGGDSALSVSALKTFIACPLHFYLSTVERLNLDDEITDSIDAAMFGNILHDAFERIYRDMKSADSDEIVVTPEKLHAVMAAPGLIHRNLVRAYNWKFARPNDESSVDTPTPPSAEILFSVMEKMIRNTLTAEAEGNPFTVLGTEVPVKTSWEIVSGHPISFKGYIDRLDRLTNDTLRMVDYKTGTDNTSASSVSELFVHKSGKNTGVILQLLTYAHLYNHQHKTDFKVSPSVYLLRQGRPGNIPLTIGSGRGNKRPITDHHDFTEEFLPLMQETLCRIFDFNDEDTEGFPMAENTEACRFCKMRILCQTTPPSW